MTQAGTRKVKKANDLVERSFSFACAVVAFNDVLSERGASAARLGDQLLLAGTSIGASVEASVAAQSRKEIAEHLNDALAGARQSLYWLRIIQRTGKAKPKDLLPSLLHEAERLIDILEDSTAA